ncbi:hypothetical protein [Sanyastnella coralliicola]|uniref:hypothetical protein n=1 Tax=Sanyastnella coralliicola TaxID=3069118 RepID=UPI0027BA931E|nr:hypothetical protein [Longitalea sp. SCSIO 12813]
MRYRIYPDINLLVNQTKGKHSLEQILMNLLTFQNDPQFNPGLNVLSDYRGCEITSDKTDFDKFMGQHLKTNHVTSNVAIITDGSKETALGMMYSLKQTKQTTRLFSSLEAACEWLDIDDERVMQFLHDEKPA